MPDQVQIIIKKYDSTIHRFNVPNDVAEAIIQQLEDRQQDEAVHAYHMEQIYKGRRNR